MRSVSLLAVALLVACDRSPAPPAPPAPPPTTAAPASFAAAPQAFVAVGTEPFWSITVADGRLVYATPEIPAGRAVTVTHAVTAQGARFAGSLDGAPLVLVISPGACSDGMSDRRYPFTARLTVDSGERRGCADLPDAKENAR